MRNHSPSHPWPEIPQALLRVGVKPASCQVQKKSPGWGRDCKSNARWPRDNRWSCSGRKAAAVHEPSHGSPGAPSSALLLHRAYLKFPTCHWDQRQELGWEGRVSAGPLVKLTVGAKTSDLNPIFPPQASLHTSKASAPASQLQLVSFHLPQGIEASVLAGARCRWKRGPHLGALGPSPAPLAAGEHPVLGVKSSPTSQPQPSHHQLG